MLTWRTKSTRVLSSSSKFGDEGIANSKVTSNGGISENGSYSGLARIPTLSVHSMSPE